MTGDKTACVKLGLCAHRLSSDGFRASNSNPGICTPDLLGMFSNKIAMIEALRLPSLCPSFPNPLQLLQRCCQYVFLRIYGYRVKPHFFAHAGGL